MTLRKKIKAIIKYLTYDPVKFWNDLGGEQYYKQFHSSNPRNEDVFFQAIGKYQPKTIIDIGCGYGRYLKAINEVYPKIQLFGVDIAESQINIAEQYLSGCKNISLAVSGNNNLPFADNSIDMAITYGCFSAVRKKDLYSFFSEIKRIVKNVGVFIENYPEKDWNIFHDNHYWYRHDYSLLFNEFSYSQKGLNKIGDTLFIVELCKLREIK